MNRTISVLFLKYSRLTMRPCDAFVPCKLGHRDAQNERNENDLFLLFHVRPWKVSTSTYPSWAWSIDTLCCVDFLFFSYCRSRTFLTRTLSASPNWRVCASYGRYGVMKSFSKKEVAKHNTIGDCWVILNGGVFDMTNFLNDHPGGSKVVMLYAGKDASEEFNMLHKPSIIKKYGPRLQIGTLKQWTRLCRI